MRGSGLFTVILAVTVLAVVLKYTHTKSRLLSQFTLVSKLPLTDPETGWHDNDATGTVKTRHGVKHHPFKQTPSQQQAGDLQPKHQAKTFISKFPSNSVKTHPYDDRVKTNSQSKTLPEKSEDEDVWGQGINKADDFGDRETVNHPRWTCPDVLTSMLTGKWKPKIMTEEQKQEINTFYKEIRRRQGLPLDLQREDRKCGTVPFPKPHHKWRAMCDADGPTPCCYEGFCTNKTSAQCKCAGCTDMRTLLHSEYASWLPVDARCQPIEMSVTEMCDLLDGYTVAFVGDSLIRHFFVAFLMTLRGDYEYGALAPDADEEIRRQCHGGYMFPKHAQCTGKIDTNAKECGGRVNAKFISYYHPDAGSPQQMISDVQGIRKLNKTFVVLGFGSHYGLKAEVTKKVSLLPLLQKLGKFPDRRNSRLIWSEMHAPTVLKSPVYAKQSYIYVKLFNSEIRKVLRNWGVPFFDTYMMTSQKLMTYDGTHFGLGVNRMKAIILLNYFLELREKGQW